MGGKTRFDLAGKADGFGFPWIQFQPQTREARFIGWCDRFQKGRPTRVKPEQLTRNGRRNQNFTEQAGQQGVLPHAEEVSNEGSVADDNHRPANSVAARKS